VGDRDLIGLLGGLVGLLGDLVLTLSSLVAIARAGVPGLPGTLGMVKLGLQGVSLLTVAALVDERDALAAARGGDLAAE